MHVSCGACHDIHQAGAQKCDSATTYLWDRRTAIFSVHVPHVSVDLQTENNGSAGVCAHKLALTCNRSCPVGQKNSEGHIKVCIQYHTRLWLMRLLRCSLSHLNASHVLASTCASHAHRFRSDSNNGCSYIFPCSVCTLLAESAICTCSSVTRLHCACGGLGLPPPNNML